MSSPELTEKLETLARQKARVEAVMNWLSYFFLGVLVSSMVAAAYEYYYVGSVVYSGASTILFYIVVFLAALLSVVLRLSLLVTRRQARALREALP